MLKVTVTNERIVNFYLNTQSIIRQLSSTGKRSRYLGVLQTVLENVEEDYKLITKKASRLEQKFAKTKDSGEFVYDGEGDKRSYVYTKKDKEELEDALEKFYKETKQIDVDEVYYLQEKDLPSENGEVVLTNQLIKVFSEFVISKELCNKLIYFGVEKKVEAKEPIEDKE